MCFLLLGQDAVLGASPPQHTGTLAAASGKENGQGGSPVYEYDLIQNPTIRLGDGSKQMSDINILLPLKGCSDCHRAYKVVTAVNGCYQW